MRARRELLAGSLAAIAAVVLAAGGASAEERISSRSGAYVDGKGRPSAVASQQVSLTPEAAATGAISGGGGGATGSDDCSWRLIIGDDRSVAVFDENGQQQHSPTGRWLERVCGGQQVAVGGQFAVPQGQGAAPPVVVDPAALAAQALASIDVPAPAIETSPAADRRLYVQVPTWLWVDDAWWRTYSATASAGGVSATVTARPVRALWSTGDGGAVTCAGPGAPWRPGAPEDATDCHHVYRHSSAGRAGDTYPLSVTVDFEVAWTSTVGAGGSLGGISRSSSRAVEVGEIQALETA